VFFDKPPFDGAALVDVYYKLVVTEAGIYRVTMNWDIGDDIDMFLCPEAGVATFDCDFGAATGAHPEIRSYPLTPGTYFIVADDFAAYDTQGPGGPPDLSTAPAVGTTLQLNVDHLPPAPPAVKAAPAPVASAKTKAAASRRQVGK
jgi:hypothetical protein